MICKIRKIMNGWLTSENEVVKTMASGMISKFEKYWRDIPGVMAIAAFLDPRNKMLLIDFQFSRLYGSDAIRQREKVIGLIKELVREYELQNSLNVSSIEDVGDSSIFRSSNILDSDEEYEQYKRDVVKNTNKSELERYLDEPAEIDSSDFDVLSWWKGNKGKYPILAKIARDIIAIPVSTVASESAFSAGGRFLSPHRRRLHPNTLKVLMCAQSWIWAPLRGMK